MSRVSRTMVNQNLVGARVRQAGGSMAGWSGMTRKLEPEATIRAVYIVADTLKVALVDDKGTTSEQYFCNVEVIDSHPLAPGPGSHAFNAFDQEAAERASGA